MVLRGAIIADCSRRDRGRRAATPMGTCTPSTANPVRADPDLGQRRHRHASSSATRAASPGGTKPTLRQRRLHLPRLEDDHPRHRVRPPAARPPADAAPRPVDRGRRGPLHRLVPAVDGRRHGDPLALTQNSTGGAGHSLTLDGQADTDYYARLHDRQPRLARNYVINVLDTGAANDGVDELAIYGVDNLDPAFNGYVPGTTTRNPTDDIFLLRASKCIDNESAVRPQTPRRPDGLHLAERDGATGPRSSRCSPATRRRRRPRPLPRPRRRATSRRASPAHQLRHRAERPAERLRPRRQRRVLRRRQQRDHDARRRRRLRPLPDRPDLRRPSATSADGALAAAGHLPGRSSRRRAAGSARASTRRSSPTGGTGNDEFVVYSNQAELRLEGDDDNDLFIVRAFALAAVCDTSADGDGDCDWDDVSLVADR